MKKIILAIALLSMKMDLFAQNKDQHVILISIDGLRPEFYKDPQWGMVHLRQALSNGSYANGVNSVFPSVTYPSHTSMVTGVLPLKHGIYYNTPAEPLGITGKWNWEYEKIKVPTLFSVAKSNGLITASIFWPVSVGNGAHYNIPEYWYLPKQKGEEREMIQALSDAALPKGFYEEIKANAIGKVTTIDYNANYFGIDDINTKAACYTIRNYKPNFLALHLVTVDHFEHEQGRDGDKVRKSIAVVDNAIQQLMEAVDKAGLKDKTTFIITGDHGFVDIHTAIHPNVWLTKAGLYDPNHPENWKAYFHSAGGATFLILRNHTDLVTKKKVEDILSLLPNNEKAMFDIKDRKALDNAGADGNAILALAPKKGFTFGNNKTGAVFTPAKGGTHGFFPDFKEIQTGFVAFGNKIKQGEVIEEMNLIDVAPLISNLLGIEMKTDGKVPRQILK